MVQGTDDNIKQNLRNQDRTSRDAPYGRNDGPAWLRSRNDQSDKTSDDIRADIDRTRAELNSTVDELQRRLSPEQIIQGVFEGLRENAGDSVKKAIQMVRDNPLPAALIGLGVIWLLVNQTKRNASLSDVECYQYEEYEVGEHVSPLV